MLLPALNNARNMARSIQCTGNLKQIGQALNMYLGDYNGYMMQYSQTFVKEGTVRWYWLLCTKGYLPRGKFSLNSDDRSIGTLNHPILCPSSAKYKNSNFTDYGLNVNLSYY
ncbi:MAG: DUF1559 domain-containing protein, partial [Lentisphaeria bacterium]|nr:DUF1559 domain-containing protein [Lentisphaeria bacterium]